MNYANSLPRSTSNSPSTVPKSTAPKQSGKTPAELDRENLLNAIEQMKERHEHDKVIVQKLTEGRPKKAEKSN